MKKLFYQLFPSRTLLLLAVYTFLLTLSLWLAYEVRFDFEIEKPWDQTFLRDLTWVIPVKLLLLFIFGQFGGLLSYFRFPDLLRIFIALSINAAFVLFLYFYYVMQGALAMVMPRSVILADFLFSLILLSFFRMSLRIARERFFSGDRSLGKAPKRVAILGAGDVGATIAGDMLSRRGLGLKPVVFLDDDQQKLKMHIHGIPIVDTTAHLDAVHRKWNLDEVIIAMPSASAMRVNEILKEARRLSLSAEIVPSLEELTAGKVRASRIRPVQIEDLLGREQVKLDSDQIREMLENKVVAVTGAGGSIGAELCRQIAHQNPKRLLLIEQSEVAMFVVEQDLIEGGYDGIIQPLIADILDEERMRYIFERFKPQIIFHAAAHKHVYLMERQPSEAFKNNVIGTRRLADLASEFQLERFVLISTDKAINPTSVMGASKRLAEIYLQAKSNDPANKTRFAAVRFGNVLGSSGSVIPIFKKQIAEGGPVKVTHPDVTRYFMTIPEAVGLVLQSGTQCVGGEIFILDMGSSVKIVDLARQMIELSGYRPKIDIEIEFIGLRPGEKLFEELMHTAETTEETQHPRIMRLKSDSQDVREIGEALDELLQKLTLLEANSIKKEFNRLVPEYSPHLD